MKGKVTAITGGGGGIGFAAAEAIAEAGGDVALLYRSAPNMEERSAELAKRFGVKVKSYQCEVTEHESVKQAIEAVEKDFGRLDCYIANVSAAGRWDLDHVLTASALQISAGRRCELSLATNNPPAQELTFSPRLASPQTGGSRLDQPGLPARGVAQDPERQLALNILRRARVRPHLQGARVRLVHRDDEHLGSDRQRPVRPTGVQLVQGGGRPLLQVARAGLAQLCEGQHHLARVSERVPALFRSSDSG
jgi:NAD(P)-dependent dehydrogenase (short-subunit alcohol dehydrogenase family)